MRNLCSLLQIATLSVITVLLSGCASFKADRTSLTRTSTSIDARTLAAPGLKRFIEVTLKRRLEPWPLESWDLPKLTLAATYFRTDLEKAPTWKVRANVRTNLLHHMAAQRRRQLLNDLSEFQSEIIRYCRDRRAENAISWEELSAVHTQYAETLIGRLDALQQIIQSRVNLAEAIGIPVRALLHVELTYDFSRGTTNEFVLDDLRRLASQNRSDIAEIDRSAAEHRAAQKHLASRLARLLVRERQRDAVAAQVEHKDQTGIGLLLLEARVAVARLAVFDAQVQVQHTLGSLEDSVQQPAKLFGLDRGHSPRRDGAADGDDFE